MNLKKFMGVQSSTSHAEKVVASLGAAISISLVYLITHWATDFQGVMVILPSMGASAVLLFAVPHGPLSQPWALFAGNTLSALVGVSCARFIPNIYLAAGCAVGAAVGLMHLTRCIHPPGGATALAAVIGGSAVHDLGYSYALLPTALNCLVMFSVAMVFNNLFGWRRYPSSLVKYTRVTDNVDTRKIQTSHITEAMQTLNEIIDVDPLQIKYLVDKADEIMLREQVKGFQVELGAFYTNGKPGSAWSVRQVVDERRHENPSKYIIVFKTVDGANKRESGSCTLLEFSEWVGQKVKPARKA